MSKHTPGPWWVGVMEANDGSVAIRNTDPEDFDNEPIRIARVDAGRDSGDARLIAAAPDLLAALVEAEKALRMDTDAMPTKDLRPIIRAAIAKARGEGR